MIVIVDSGGANIASIVYALERLGHRAILSDDRHTIQKASHVILPGVGSADHAMQQLHHKNLISVLQQLTQPVLGICLGMHLLYAFSEEHSDAVLNHHHSEKNNVACLGIIPGNIQKMPATSDCRVPHMGWNTYQITQANPWVDVSHAKQHLYFVHSYYAPVSSHTIATSQHSVPFSAMVQHHNFFGIQAHPERSGAVGAALLKRFLEVQL